MRVVIAIPFFDKQRRRRKAFAFRAVAARWQRASPNRAEVFDFANGREGLLCAAERRDQDLFDPVSGADFSSVFGSGFCSPCAVFSMPLVCGSFVGAPAGFAFEETDSGFMLGVFVICRGVPFKAGGNELPLHRHMVARAPIYNHRYQIRQR
jgi:hypothetical protein